jgi:outer membrane protein TolC
LERYERDLAQEGFGSKRHMGPEEIDPEKVYTLPELIDIAQRANPQTRIAWERARQAAATVGLSESTYFPYLVASAAAGYDHTFIPFPILQTGPGPREVSIARGGTLVTDAAEGKATLGVKWLLLDFGQRKAATTMAKEELMAANVGFNAVHQKIVFMVTKSFYQLNAAREKVGVAESAASTAQTVTESVQAQFGRGLATKPDVLQAEQQSAQASFELEAARGALSDAQVALVQSLGILPTTKIRVAEVSEKPFPKNTDDTEELIDRALARRPDLVAKLANVRARQAGVRKAQAAYYPQISLDAHAGGAALDVSMANSRFFGGGEPVYGGGLSLEWTIFDGFSRRKKLTIAESELRVAEEELADSRDAVIREVWKARTDFETALRKQDSATKLVAAAEVAFSASIQAFNQGVGTYVEVANAQRNVTTARSTAVDTRANIYNSAVALAYSVGDLARPAGSAPPPTRRHRQ